MALTRNETTDEWAAHYLSRRRLIKWLKYELIFLKENVTYQEMKDEENRTHILILQLNDKSWH